MATKNGINDLKTRCEELKNKEYKVGDLIFGTIQMREVTCGYANCKCKKGNPHGLYTYRVFLSDRKRKAISAYLSGDDMQIIAQVRHLKLTITLRYNDFNLDITVTPELLGV